MTVERLGVDEVDDSEAASSRSAASRSRIEISRMNLGGNSVALGGRLRERARCARRDERAREDNRR